MNKEKLSNKIEDSTNENVKEAQAFSDVVEKVQVQTQERNEIKKEVSKAMQKSETVTQEKDSINEQKGRLSGLVETLRKSKLAKMAVLGGSLAVANPELAQAIVNMESIGQMTQHSLQQKDSQKISNQVKSEQLVDNETVQETELNLDSPKDRNIVATQIKNEIIEHMRSQVYLDKLISENNGDVEKANEMQKQRLLALEEVKTHANVQRGSDEINFALENNIAQQDGFDKLSDNMKKDVLQYAKNKYLDKKSSGLYDSSQHALYIFDDVRGGKFTNAVRHELLHGATNMDELISVNARSTLDETFQDYQIKSGISKMGIRDYNNYLKDHSERLVRKQQLDKQLEELGIRTYGDEFTQEQFSQMKKAQKEGKFSKDVKQFLETTKPTFETYKMIFDTVAENQKKNREGIV